MENIGERIRQLREALGNGDRKISQAEFAKRIGVGATAIGNLEAGIRSPSERTINDICREYNVNKQWLMTGEGAMFNPLTRSNEIAAFIGRVLSDNPDGVKQRLIWALSQLDESDWDVLDRILRSIADGTEKERTDPE